MTDPVVYVDSSALIKLIFEEPETPALQAFLGAYPRGASSTLTQIEVHRTVGRVQDPIVAREADQILERIHLIRADDSILAAAMKVAPSTLRTLDALHLVTALSLRPNLAGMVVYDRTLAAAAEAAGLTVFAPA